jgi:hydroxyacid-oxoacid transhydrogenase
MACCHYFAEKEGNETIFSVDATAINIGHGALKELGHEAKMLNMSRVAVFTDTQVSKLWFFEEALASCKREGVDVTVFDESRVEPSDRSLISAIEFAMEGKFDGLISIGGGSVIDTCKVANLYSSYPAVFEDYVNAPLGKGIAVPGPIMPHIACPTTAGTGSECTGIAVFDLLSQGVKTGIASKFLKPNRALVEPAVTQSLPATVVACSGFDVLSHALESYTASPFTNRNKPANPGARPLSQGANPWSDIGCREALRLTGQYLVRAVTDANDQEARENMMFAATLAGIAFGNSGVHIPHAMSYSVAGMIEDFNPAGYPSDHAMCPHGMSVIVNAPAVFRYTAEHCPQRHLQAAELLGADINGAHDDDAGEILAMRISEMMQKTDMPNGVAGIGYSDSHVADLASGAFAQQRLLSNAPCDVRESDLELLYRQAMNYW